MSVHFNSRALQTIMHKCWHCYSKRAIFHAVSLHSILWRHILCHLAVRNASSAQFNEYILVQSYSCTP